MNKKILIILAFALLIAVPASAQQVRVKGNRTPLRDEPRATSSVVAYYQMGSVLEALALVDGWYRVRDPQRRLEGYVMATLVELLSGGTPAPPMPAQPGGEAPKPTGTPTAAQVQRGPQPVAPKPARKSGGWTDHGYLSVGGVYQFRSKAFSEGYSYTEYLEQASVITDYPATEGPGFDVGGAVRLWRNLALSVSVTYVDRSTAGTVTAAIPHPFFFNQSRSISGPVDLKRTEIAVHPFVSWAIPAGRRFLIVIGGGPSIFNLNQSLVEDVSYTQSYPFDSATFTSATVARHSAWIVGYGGSADVTYYFSKYVGVGGVARYARGTVSLPSHGATLKVDTGGFEAGLSLRFRIPQGPPKKPVVKRPLPPPPPGKR
jgi:hypothetical protein